MLYSAMPTIPVSDLRNKQSETLDQLGETPVMLTRGGHSAGVLVHPDTWNLLVNEVARLRRMVRADQIVAEMKAGSYLTQEEFEKAMAGN